MSGRIVDYRDSQKHPKRPLMLACDFCGREVDRLWCWAVRPICAVSLKRVGMEYQGGRWCACTRCYPWVESRDLPSLLVRIMRLLPDPKPPVEYFEHFYAAVFAAMVDAPPVVWLAGDLWPVP